MWKLFIILLFVGVGITGFFGLNISMDEYGECQDCNDRIDNVIQDILREILLSDEPFETSIPDCEFCNVTGLENAARYNDSCVTEVNNCAIQVTPFVLDSAVINCSCDLNTKSGKKMGGIHGYIEKPMFSIRVNSCTEKLGEPHLYEDSHIGAQQLHITCDGDDEFSKACKEEQHNYNVDNVVIAVGRIIVKVLNSDVADMDKIAFDCR